MSRPILNLDEVTYFDFGHGGAPIPGSGVAPEAFQAKLGTIGTRIGAKKLGYNVTVVPAGKRAFPLHSHRVNEEMFFVLEGAGEVRIGAETYPLRAGDVVACPPGEADTAHQIINTGSGELKYLAVSTAMSPEVCEYPDSGKFGVTVESGRAENGRPLGFRFLGRAGETKEYWDGE